jgi:hypothetical protein
VRTVEILAGILLLVGISASGSAQAGSALEAIEADTALAEIQRSRGVVLLDVYAEW